MGWLKDTLEGFNANEKIRKQEIAALSSKLKMSYQEEESFKSIPLLGEFQLGKQGSDKKIRNVLQYTDEWHDTEFRVFDYYYSIKSNNSSTTYRQTVFFVRSKQLALPEFLLKPEHFFHKIGAFLGFKDINFERHPKFSGQYYLKGPEEEHIRGLMTDNVLHYFSLNDGWSLEGINYFLIFYRHNKLIQPNWIDQFYIKGREIFDMLLAEQPRFDLPGDTEQQDL